MNWFESVKAMGLLGVMLLAGCVTPRLEVPAARIASRASGVEIPAVPNGSEGSQSIQPSDSSSSSDTKPRGVVEMLSHSVSPVELPKSPDLSAKFSSTNALTVAVEAMPTRNFLNYIFGEMLRVNYIIVEGTPGLDEPVTFNAQKPVSSRQLFRLVTQLISSRGIDIVERESTFFIGPSNAKTRDGIQLGYGRNSADVPDVGGDILQIIPLKYGINYTLYNTAGSFTNLKITPDPDWNAYFVTGTRTEILKFIDLVNLFDRPTARGNKVGMLNLTYIGAEEFVGQVGTLLEKEGIKLGSSPLTLVPLDRLAAVVVFASTDEMLERVEFWAKQLDRPGEGPTQRYFVYQPRFARAADLGESIAALLGTASEGQGKGNFSRDTRSALGDQSLAQAAAAAPGAVLRREPATVGAGEINQGPTTASGNGITLSIDKRSNSLIFYTTGPRYEALLPMIRRLDVSPKQIVLEAMIAEVSLTGEFANGVEFAFREGRLAGGTVGGLGLPTGGLALTFDANIADQIRLRLQASDTRINVLSSPILVVRDGVSASIQVGNDVPTVGATASSPTQSDRLVTTVLYRNTGLGLQITPNINAQGAVLLQITQSTTSTVPGSSGVSGAPIFFQRSVSTEVVAASGQTVFLAGLRSESDSTSNARVPVAGNIPLIGRLFRSDTKRREKTELVVLITPRIVEGVSEWRQIMNDLKNSLNLLSIPSP